MPPYPDTWNQEHSIKQERLTASSDRIGTFDRTDTDSGIHSDNLKAEMDRFWTGTQAPGPSFTNAFCAQPGPEGSHRIVLSIGVDKDPVDPPRMKRQVDDLVSARLSPVEWQLRNIEDISITGQPKSPRTDTSSTPRTVSCDYRTPRTDTSGPSSDTVPRPADLQQAFSQRHVSTPRAGLSVGGPGHTPFPRLPMGQQHGPAHFSSTLNATPPSWTSSDDSAPEADSPARFTMALGFCSQIWFYLSESD